MSYSTNFLLLLSLITTQFYSITSYNAKILDGTHENTLIIDLKSVPQFGLMNYITTETNEIQYNLLSNKKINNLFNLHANGRLYTAQLIDREEMCNQIDECCDNSKPCELLLMIAIKYPNSMEPRTFDLRILIEDINDHTPKFPKDQIMISIKESDQIGSLYPLPLAQDLDSDKFNIKMYELDYESSSSSSSSSSSLPSPFTLDKQHTNTNLNLQLIRKLDREKIDQYTLKLLAKDKGKPPKIGEMIIQIRIIDVNDNGPILKKVNYAVDFKEGDYISQPLVKIETTDADEGKNAELQYKLIDIIPTKSNINNYFRIEQSSGEIYLKQSLDYERQTRHRFFVEVSNVIYHPITATATVLITVINYNDEKPEININYLNDIKTKAIIKENEKKGQFVALATVTDKDDGPDGQVRCELLNYNDIFELQEKDIGQKRKQYYIYTKQSLDREKVEVYLLRLLCEDEGLPVKQKTEAQIKIEVEDENDNKPIIISTSNNNLNHMDINRKGFVSVKENQPPGTLVTIIKATDPDKGKNSKLIYSIDEVSNENVLRYFKIDSINGELRTKSIIDREMSIPPLESFTIQIIVKDMGTPSLSTKENLIIQIEDINDNAPQFQTKSIMFMVKENNPARYTIGEIPVTDRDDTKSLRVTLLPSTNFMSSPFILINQNGKYLLNTTRTLDWEREKNFTLKVIASDGRGYNSHTSTAQIIIVIEDENDHAPEIIFPTYSNKTTQNLSYREPAGFDIITISAIDKDNKETQNGKFYYQLQPAPSTNPLPKDPNDIFMINSNGKICTTRQMTKDDIGQYRIQIIVSDHGIPPKQTSTILLINIDNSKPYSVNIYKNNNNNINNNNNLNNNNKGNYNNYNYSQHNRNYFWSKEGLLVLSLIILVLFLVICIMMVLYMRHSRGLFPMLPDLIDDCCCNCCCDETFNNNNNNNINGGNGTMNSRGLDSSELNQKMNAHHKNQQHLFDLRKQQQKSLLQLTASNGADINSHDNGGATGGGTGVGHTSPMLVHKFLRNENSSPISYFQSYPQSPHFDPNNNSNMDIQQQQLLFNNPSMNAMRQYETMNFTSYPSSTNPLITAPPPHITATTNLYGGPPNTTYDKLFYHVTPTSLQYDDSSVAIVNHQPIVSKLNNTIHKTKYPLNTSTFCNRIVNNIDQQQQQQQNLGNQRYPSDPCLNKPTDNVPLNTTPSEQNLTPNTRKKNFSRTLPLSNNNNNNIDPNNDINSGIDTYAVSFPKEQSTFV